MVTVKRNGASAPVWRSSALAGDNSSFFLNTAESANYIQALNTDGFQVGTNAALNTAAAVNYWFAFKSGANFAVGSYTGTGAAQNITTAGMLAEYVWVKRSTAVNGVSKPVSLSGTNSQYFTNLANVADRITGYVKGGFSVGGAQTETNTNTATYRYATWNDPEHGTLSADIVDAAGNPVASPSYALTTAPYSFECMSRTSTIATSAQRIRVLNFTQTPGWSLSIAPTSGATALWRNVGDTQRYDFNESSGTPTGCTDGADADSVAGVLSFNASAGTIGPETGCSSTNLTASGSTAFSEGVTNSVELLNANSSANPDCYFDLTSVELTQTIPREQPIDSYSINLTLTVVAN